MDVEWQRVNVFATARAQYGKVWEALPFTHTTDKLRSYRRPRRSGRYAEAFARSLHRGGRAFVLSGKLNSSYWVELTQQSAVAGGTRSFAGIVAGGPAC